MRLKNIIFFSLFFYLSMFPKSHSEAPPTPTPTPTLKDWSEFAEKTNKSKDGSIIHKGLEDATNLSKAEMEFMKFFGYIQMAMPALQILVQILTSNAAQSVPDCKIISKVALMMDVASLASIAMRIGIIIKDFQETFELTNEMISTLEKDCKTTQIDHVEFFNWMSKNANLVYNTAKLNNIADGIDLSIASIEFIIAMFELPALDKVCSLSK